MRHKRVTLRVTTIIAALFVAAIAVPTNPVPVGAAGDDYDGFSHGSVIHVDAITNATTRVADVEVGVSNAAVNSNGLKRVLNAYSREIVPDGLSGKKSRGHSSIVEVGLVHAPDAANQVAPFVAESTSPGGADVDMALLSQTVAPIAHVDVLRRIARSRWNADTCVLGEPIALGEQHLAKAQALETSADAATADFDGAVAGVSADTAGPDRSATQIVSKEQLYVAGGTVGLQSVSTATLAPVTLLEGTAQEFTVEVSGPAYLSAAANGKAGGANVLFQVPLVSIIQGESITEMLPGQEIDVRVPPGTGPAIAHIKVGVMESVEEKANGTSASAVGNVVEIALLDVPGTLRGATVAIGHMESETNVPAGGIDCPLPVSKSANPRSVSVDDLFTVTITVHNPFACPLTGVTLVDTSSVQSDARFEFVKTAPKANSAAKGANLSKGAATWSLGTIQPGKSASVKATMQAQGGAGKILDTAIASGALTNCNAGLGEAEADVSALASVKVPVSGKATLVVNEAAVKGKTILPQTGVGSASVTGLLLLSSSGAVALIARRRRIV